MYMSKYYIYAWYGGWRWGWGAVRYERLVGWLLNDLKKVLLTIGFVYALCFVFVNFVGWNVDRGSSFVILF